MSFDGVVFSGGGNRCLWQAGFWSIASEALHLKPQQVVAVSAGSAVACALFAGTFADGFAGFLRAVALNERNLYLRNVLGRDPVFPHGGMYRDAILGSIDAQALSRLHQGPELRVLVSAAPVWAGRSLSMLLGAVASSVDMVNGDAVHACAARKLGFEPLYISVRECATPEALADLILASSCVPPLTPQAHRAGAPIFDGGLVNNVPMDGLPAVKGEVLVLLTRQFRRLPSIPGRTYVQPSRPIPAGAWDYTSDAAIQSTYDLGRRDGETFCQQMKRHKNRPAQRAQVVEAVV